MIYFIQADILGRIKIGYTSKKKIGDRLSSIQSHSPVPLKLLVTIRGDQAREQRLHAKFAEYHVHGEWFEPGPRLVKFIARLQGRFGKPRDSVRKIRRKAAVNWLRDRFAEHNEWLSLELLEAARRAGISRSALFEAKSELGLPRAIRKGRPDGPPAYFWRAPLAWAELIQPKHETDSVESLELVVVPQGVTTDSTSNHLPSLNHLIPNPSDSSESVEVAVEPVLNPYTPTTNSSDSSGSITSGA